MVEKTLKRIPIDKLLPDNLRELDTDHVDWLEANIRENGLDEELEVYEHPTEEGKYNIFDGHHRHAAILRINAEDSEYYATVPCMIRVVPKDKLELRVHQLLVNMGRKAFCSADIAKAIQKFKNLGMETEAIARRLGKSQAWVTQHLKLEMNGSPKLKEANRKGKVLSSTAQQLANFDIKAQDKWVKKITRAKGKAETPREASRAEAALLAQAFKKDRPKGMKPRFPSPMRKKELARLMADLYELGESYKSRKKGDIIEPHEKHIEGVLRGISLVFGASMDALYEENFSVKKWFKQTFGDDITADRWFE